MSDKLKQIDKKYLMIGGAIIGLLVLVIIIMVVIKLLSGPGKNYNKVEQKIVTAAQEYFKKNPDAIPKEGTSTHIDADTLITDGHLKDLEKLIDDTCTASVTVMNNGGKSLYLPDLECTEYKTIHFKEKIVEDQLVKDSENPYESGLYEVDGEYIFKGKNTNNYVSFGTLTWRILKIDKNGNLKLIKEPAEKSKKIWDNKYNIELKKSRGVNDYANSYLLEYLNESYEGVNDNNKAHLIPHDVCIGKRSFKNTKISYDVDCSEVLENQYLSTINTLDYPMASLDENCKEVGSGSCTNYNYLNSTITTSWTTIGSADNTYEVFYISAGYVGTLNANKSNSYNWVVYVSGEELYTTGDGTLENPYVIQ